MKTFARFSLLLTATACLTLTMTEAKADVFWTDWISGISGASGSALGTLDVDGTPVAVSYTGEVAFIQTGAGGETNYWNPSAPYISPTVPTAPPGTDIIGLSLATSKTITFSQPITNPLFAVVSLNGNGYQFDRDFNILSFGQGFWGNGTLTKTNPTPGIFQLNGTGEPHGVIQFQGTFSSVTWTSLTNEFWNGFTIGVAGIAVVPEPSSILLMVAGAGVAGATFLKRRKAA